MKITEEQTDETILLELGGRLARWRVDSALTQAEVARAAGVSKRTLERLEAGGATQTSTLIRVLRTLGLLSGLDRAIPEPRTSPLELLDHQAKPRKRAPRKRTREADTADDADKREWTWGDEA